MDPSSCWSTDAPTTRIQAQDQPERIRSTRGYDRRKNQTNNDDRREGTGPDRTGPNRPLCPRPGGSCPSLFWGGAATNQVSGSRRRRRRRRRTSPPARVGTNAALSSCLPCLPALPSLSGLPPSSPHAQLAAPRIAAASCSPLTLSFLSFPSFPRFSRGVPLLIQDTLSKRKGEPKPS
jgi:hypothetical protein